MTPAPYCLASLTWRELADLPLSEAVVIVPVGATEQHGHALPLGTDFTMAEEVAGRSAERLVAQGEKVLVTPPVWTGYSPHHMSYAGTITLSAATFTALVSDVATSLWNHGVRKILFLNGHGGNAQLLAAAVQELRYQRGVRAAAASYWSLASDAVSRWRLSDRGGINHACEMETSLMAAAHPGVVRPVAGVGTPSDPGLTGTVRDLADPAAVAVALAFDELSEDGSLGAWHLADAERGAELLEEIVSAVAGFVREFGQWEWPEQKQQR